MNGNLAVVGAPAAPGRPGDGYGPPGQRLPGGAGLAAAGATEVLRVYHWIGLRPLVEKLAALGARIKRVPQ